MVGLSTMKTVKLFKIVQISDIHQVQSVDGVYVSVFIHCSVGDCWGSCWLLVVGWMIVVSCCLLVVDVCACIWLW